MAVFWRTVICMATISSSMAIFIGGEQDVGSPLRVAQCRATCLERGIGDPLTCDTSNYTNLWINREIGTTPTSSGGSISNSSEECSVPTSAFDLDNVLRRFPNGNYVYLVYEQNKKLNDATRKIIVDAVIAWHIENNVNLRRDGFERIATAIEKRFHDDKFIYYKKRGLKKNPSGRLYDKYYNHTKRLKKIGLNRKALISHIDGTTDGTNTIVPLLTEECNLTADEIANLTAWLRVNNSPWTDVQEKWRKTFAKRRTDILEETVETRITNVLMNWPLLKTSQGFNLFSNDGPNGESMCLQGPDCFMCWENCELLQSNFQVWGAMCDEKEICFPGCQEACRFHAEASTRAQQAQPVIHTKGEGVIRVSGGLAVWPRPSSSSTTTPLIYVVMRKSQSGPWRQVIQTLDLTTRVPLNSDLPGSMLRVLVVDPQGLVTIYSPDEATMRDGKKKKKTINTEIKATTSKSTGNDLIEPWMLREISLIHQKVLVIGEIAWEPKATRGVYLVTWEVDGGGLKGNLFTDSTCVTLSLWPDTIYHIQVELVSRTPGVENLKSEMMDLDTGRAQKVSTESQEDLNMIQGDVREDVDFNSPLLSVLVGAVRGEKSMHKWHSMELILGCCAAIVLFSLILLVTFWRCRHHSALDNIITGSTSIRSHKLVEDYTGYSGFQPVMTAVATVSAKTHANTRSSPSPPNPLTPDVVFSGATATGVHRSSLLQESEKTVRNQVNV